ncbi:hypothetical protein [Georgenia sp. Marseille-Q6866]
MALASTEVVRAQLDLTSAGLTAELVRDDSGRIHRAEALWGRADHPSDDPVKLRAGDLVEASFTTTLDLGGADGASIWAVSWQLIGPDSAGTWPPPPLALTVGNGRWRVGGGDGYPGGSREAYADTGVPFRDGETIRWDVRVALEHGAGSVDVWADGAHVVEGWRPPGGTMHPDQPHVLMKTGIYTGGGGAAGLRSRMQIADAAAALYRAPEK